MVNKKIVATHCCVCQKIKEEGEWVDKGFNSLLEIVKRYKSDNISSGYCPPCFDEVMDKIKAM